MLLPEFQNGGLKMLKATHKNLNSVFKVRFGETSATIKIIEVVSDKKILWQVMDSNLPIFKNVKDWNYTKMSWEISNENNLKKISFTHKGLIPEHECYSMCAQGWDMFIK
jgi:hypothetical protein